MSAHRRRHILLRVVVAVLTAALPAAWALGWIRAAARAACWRVNRRRRRIPARAVDGEPLTDEEFRAFIAILCGWDQTTPEPERRS